MKRAFQNLVALLALVGSALATPRGPVNNPIYIISNAEQPSLFRPGLSPIGEQRVAQCLPQLFSTLDIGKIISCPRNDESQVCFETLATAQPIADALGLPIDTTCGADENTSDDCISGLTTKFAKNSTQAILIVWEFSEVHTLLEESLDLDTDPADAIDGIHYDVFTTVIKGKITQVTSQNCTNIDGIAPGTDVAPPSKPTKGSKRRSVAGAGEKRRRRERKSRSRQL